MSPYSNNAWNSVILTSHLPSLELGGVGLARLVIAAAIMSRPRKRSNIPLNLVRPFKQKRVKVDRVSATLPASSTVIEPHHDEPPPSEGIDHDSSYPCGDELDMQPEECQSAKFQSDVSSHTRRKERAAAKWDEIRADALSVMIEESSLPSGVTCFACGTEDATVRCLYCGPQHFFCEHCAVQLHTHALYHHCPEVWKVRDIYSEPSLSFVTIRTQCLQDLELLLNAKCSEIHVESW